MSRPSRRAVLQVGGLTALAVALPSAPARAATPLTLAGARAAVGQAFPVVGRGFSLRLVAVDDLSRPQPVPGSGEAFALRFEDRRPARLAEVVHDLGGPFGRLRLLLVPLGARRYDAVVNHWRPARRP